MNVFEISIASSGSHFTQENQIFENTFFLEFEWVEREKFWLFHISNESQEYLACGLRLHPRWPLYNHFGGKTPFSLILLGTGNTQELARNTLKQYFSLVAYEAL